MRQAIGTGSFMALVLISTAVVHAQEFSAQCVASISAASDEPASAFRQAQYDAQARHALIRAYRALRASANFPGQACGREEVAKELDAAYDELRRLPPDPLDIASHRDLDDEKKKLREKLFQAVRKLLEGKPPASVNDIIDVIKFEPKEGSGTGWAKSVMLAGIETEKGRIAAIPDWGGSIERPEFERIMAVREQLRTQAKDIHAVLTQGELDARRRQREIEGINELSALLHSVPAFPQTPLRDPPPIPLSMAPSMVQAPPPQQAPTPPPPRPALPTQPQIELGPPR